MSENKEIGIRDIILTLKEIKNELFSKSLRIGIFVLLFSIIAVGLNQLISYKYEVLGKGNIRK